MPLRNSIYFASQNSIYRFAVRYAPLAERACAGSFYKCSIISLDNTQLSCYNITKQKKEVKMLRFLIKKLSPARIIALGFAAVILIGSVLLILPCSVREGQDVKYIDALYTSTSAVCVTGLIAIDTGTAFTPLGQFFLALLIQIGGLGVTSVGAGIILAMGGKLRTKGRSLVQEASNLGTAKGTVKFIRSVFLLTLAFELTGAALSFIVFIQDYPFFEAVGHSLFHAVAAFNNSGFDNLGHSGELYSNTNLFAYHDNILLNLVTAGLIFFGGIGFLVIREMLEKKWHWKRYSMHAKVVLTTSAVLIAVGTLLIKLTETSESWLGAFFQSVTTRTAGFSTSNIGNYSSAALLVMMILMFIGASPGSTGGGIKTSTFFVLLQGIKSAATNRSERAFKYSIPKEAFKKAAVITLMSLLVVLTGTYLLSVFENGNESVTFIDALFEITSAFGTVGLSTGITPNLSVAGKLLSILIMYIGRLGPLTIATLWYFTKGERAEYPDGNIAIG